METISPRFQEIIRYCDRLVEHTAAIVAQVDDIALGSRADLFLERAHGRLQSVIGVLVEGRNADVADIAFAMEFHRFDFDDGARQLHVERFVG